MPYPEIFLLIYPSSPEIFLLKKQSFPKIFYPEQGNV